VSLSFASSMCTRALLVKLKVVHQVAGCAMLQRSSDRSNACRHASLLLPLRTSLPCKLFLVQDGNSLYVPELMGRHRTANATSSSGLPAAPSAAAAP